MLGSPAALAKFKEGSGNGGWLDGTQAMLHKASYVVAGGIGGWGGNMGERLERNALRACNHNALRHLAS